MSRASDFSSAQSEAEQNRPESKDSPFADLKALPAVHIPCQTDGILDDDLFEFLERDIDKT